MSGCATTPDQAASGQAAAAASGQGQGDQIRIRLIGAGNRALRARDYREAFASFSRAVDLDSNDGEALIGLAESYLGARNLPKAVETFQKAQRIAPGSAVALQGEGLALALMGKREASHAQLLAAIENDNTLWRAWNALGRSHDLTGAWSQAEDAYAQALRLNPEAAEVHSNRGVSRLLQKRYPAAAAAFEAAIDLEPSLQEAKENRRLALAFAGRYEDAVAGVAPEQRQTVLNNVGYVALQRRDFAAAEKYLHEAMNTSATFYAKAAENLEQLRISRNMAAVQNRFQPVSASVGLTAPEPRPLPRPPVAVVNAPAFAAAKSKGPLSIIPASAEPPAASPDEAADTFATSAGPAGGPEASRNADAEPSAAPTFKIQLGAVRSEAEARAEWPRLKKAYPSLLGHLELSVERTETASSDVLYRIQAGPFAERAASESVCRELLKLRTPCQPVRRGEP